MPTIEERMKVHIRREVINTMDVTHVTVTLDGDVLATEKYNHSHQPTWKKLSSNMFAQQVLSKVKEEWKACDQTLNSEPQYRKTIISSCGLLQVNLQPL